MKDMFGFDQPEGGYKGKKRMNTQARGYAGIPGTGPDGETCGTCRHHVVRQYAKRYHKCELNKSNWTGGVASDIRVRSPACGKWEPKKAGVE